MYAKCGSMTEAREIFDKMKRRTVVSWNAIILGYAERGEGELALKLFSSMKQQNCFPNRVTYMAALKACASLATKEEGKRVEGRFVKVRSLEKGRAIHSEISETEFELHNYVASSLVDMYGKCGSMSDARSVFDRMRNHDVVSWTSIILGYGESGRADAALVMFSRMQDEGVRPNSVTYLAVLKACAGLAGREEAADRELVRFRCLETGRAIHSQVLRTGYESENYLANALLDMYGKCGSFAEAQRFFDGMQKLDTVSWNAIILAWIDSGNGEQALDVFMRMQEEGFVPSCVTYLAALKACVNLAAEEEAKQVDGRAVKLNCLKKGRMIHSALRKTGQEKHIFVASMLVDMYGKCGSPEEARTVFDAMEERDVLSWTAMISGFAESGESDLALEFFARMQEEVVPNAVTFLAALTACGSLGALQAGKMIHAEICSAGSEIELPVATALVEFYGKCGSVADAERVFGSVSSTDLVIWNALIAAFSRQGCSGRVFELFDCLRREEGGRLRPSGVTFVSVLSACSRSGLVEKGRKYFAMMWEEYEMNPSEEHYSCMVDLLGRANRLDEAVEMAEEMAERRAAGVMVWMTVLSGCRKWGNVGVGRVAFEKILEVEGGEGGGCAAAYVLMANVYAGAGMFKESEEMTKFESRIKKMS